MSFSIIIPSKSASNLVPCVKAIRAAGETARIIVVDDGVDWPFCSALDNGGSGRGPLLGISGIKPFIFSRNVNIGILAAGDDDVIILNDDALLKSRYGFHWLESHHCDKPEYGIISAACNTTGNPNQHPRNQLGLRDDPRTVCFICVYIPRSTINTVGLLDERFVYYGMEDDDYCLRVRKAGMKLGICDQCFVDHSQLVSSFRGGPTTGGDFIPNMRIFIEKWGVDNWNQPRERSQFAHLFPAEVAK
jgi:glycosyltransferase involved in cell wall biosynthesis